MPYIDVDSNKTYYTGNLKNEGIPIIFIHGSGGGHHHFGYQVNYLNKYTCPIAIDLPGHGKSGGEAFHNIANYRDFLHAFIKKGINKPYIIAGHSMGGAIALDYALKYDHNLLAIILISTGSRLKVLPDLLQSLSEGIIPNNLSKYLYAETAPGDLVERGKIELESTSPAVLYADFLACNSFNVTNRLYEITIPAHIICGTADRMTPLKYSQFLQKELENSSISKVDDASHMVMIEKPNEVNIAIQQFISNQFK